MIRRPPLTDPTLLGLLIATLILAAADWGSQMAGDSVIPGGPLDETAHLATCLLVLWALGPRISRRFLLPALVASVAIDADHIPQHLGIDWLTVGTPRPYTHSLLTIVVVLAAAWAWRSRREVMLGVAIGLVIHFWRDLAEPGSGVALLWPFSYHSFSLPHAQYVAVMALVVVIDGFRCVLARPQPDDSSAARSGQGRMPGGPTLEATPEASL